MAEVIAVVDDGSSEFVSPAVVAALEEKIRDVIGSALVAGSNVTLTVNDAGNTITVAASGGGGTDPEVVRDTIAAALVAGANVTITPDDAGDTITIAASGGGSLFADPNFDAIAFWDDSAAAFAPLSLGTPLAISGTTLAVGTATTANRGVVELATVTEATTGTDTTRAVTPEGLTATRGLYVGVNAQTGTSYAPVLSDQGKLVTCTNAGAITVTLPSNATTAFPIGAQIDFVVLGAGMVTFVAGSGATANGTPSLVTRAQYSAATAIKVSTNGWIVVGDLA